MGLPNKITSETPSILSEKNLHAMLKRDLFEDKEESVVSVSVLKIKLPISAEVEEEEEDGINGGCSTPKTVDQKIHVNPPKCPPPPRKPKSVPSTKRKAHRVFLDLSKEIDSLFPSNVLRDFMFGKINKVRKLSS